MLVKLRSFLIFGFGVELLSRIANSRLSMASIAMQVGDIYTTNIRN